MTTSGTEGMRAAGIVAIGIAIGGCSAATHPVGQAATSPTSSPSKHIVHGTGNLRMTITPTRGPVGTEVSIKATGCGDPDGQNHAVSFNPGFGNTLQAAEAHYHLSDIRSHLAGQTLTATYTITAKDAHAAARAESPPPRFYVQCRDDLADAVFLITR